MACKCRDHAGFDSKSCTVLNLLAEQSPDIAQAVHVNKSVEELGAGDQVSQSMFSYIVPTLRCCHKCFVLRRDLCVAMQVMRLRK